MRFLYVSIHLAPQGGGYMFPKGHFAAYSGGSLVGAGATREEAFLMADRYAKKNGYTGADYR